jgi:hypothetical protein
MPTQRSSHRKMQVRNKSRVSLKRRRPGREHGQLELRGAADADAEDAATGSHIARRQVLRRLSPRRALALALHLAEHAIDEVACIPLAQQC